MSHNSSRKGARDIAKPLVQRASHVRSCVNHVANRLGSTREQILAQILRTTGVDLNDPKSEDDLMRAFEALEGLHNQGQSQVD